MEVINTYEHDGGTIFLFQEEISIGDILRVHRITQVIRWDDVHTSKKVYWEKDEFDSCDWGQINKRTITDAKQLETLNREYKLMKVKSLRKKKLERILK